MPVDDVVGNGLPCCSNTRPRCDARSASKRAHEPRACVNQPPLRMSIIVPPAASTARSSASSPPANGSARAATSSSPGRAASAKAGSPAPWDKACKEDFSVLYHRVPRLFAALALARGDGRYAKLLRALGRGLSTLAPLRALRARTLDRAWARRLVGEGVKFLSESRMREICMSGSIGSDSSSSTIGVRRRSRPTKPATCSKSSRIATPPDRFF